MHAHIAIDVVSIHAPRRGSDESPRRSQKHTNSFNPRSPQGERQGMSIGIMTMVWFQSTLPAGGATPASIAGFASWSFQSTLPAGGAT